MDATATLFAAGLADDRFLCTADLRTKITDFRGFDSNRILILRGGILMSGHVHEEFPGKLESSNLSRNNLSRDIHLQAEWQRGVRPIPLLTLWSSEGLTAA